MATRLSLAPAPGASHILSQNFSHLNSLFRYLNFNECNHREKQAPIVLDLESSSSSGSTNERVLKGGLIDLSNLPSSPGSYERLLSESDFDSDFQARYDEKIDDILVDDGARSSPRSEKFELETDSYEKVGPQKLEKDEPTLESKYDTKKEGEDIRGSKKPKEAKKEKRTFLLCAYCGHRNVDAEDHEKHELVHLGFLPYACTKCDFKTDAKRCLSQHSQQHMPETRFKCPHCEYTATYRHNLKTRLGKHSSKIFKCPDCDYQTTIEPYLKIHVKRHGTKDFKCEVCDLATFTQSELNAHGRRAHLEKEVK